jgi:hypothetical protein
MVSVTDIVHDDALRGWICQEVCPSLTTSGQKNTVIEMENVYRKAQESIPDHDFRTSPGCISNNLVPITPKLPDNISKITTLEPSRFIQQFNHIHNAPQICGDVPDDI